MSPSASTSASTASVAANALTNGKLVFQCPNAFEGTSHMWLRANTARRGSSRQVSRKSRANSRRGEGDTPQHHSRNPLADSRRARPETFVSSTSHSSTVSSTSTKRVQRDAIPWWSASNTV